MYMPEDTHARTQANKQTNKHIYSSTPLPHAKNLRLMPRPLQDSVCVCVRERGEGVRKDSTHPRLRLNKWKKILFSQWKKVTPLKHKKAITAGAERHLHNQFLLTHTGLAVCVSVSSTETQLHFLFFFKWHSHSQILIFTLELLAHVHAKLQFGLLRLNWGKRERRREGGGRKKEKEKKKTCMWTDGCMNKLADRLLNTLKEKQRHSPLPASIFDPVHAPFGVTCL